MDYDAILAQALALLQQQKRLSCRVLKRRLHLDDEVLEGLKEEPIYAEQLVVDEDGTILVWIGASGIQADRTPASEFLYQRGLPPQATYRFKPALIQEAA